MGKLLFYHFRVTNSRLKNKKFPFELLTRKMQKLHLDFEIAQDFFIEMNYTIQNYLKKKCRHVGHAYIPNPEPGTLRPHTLRPGTQDPGTWDSGTRDPGTRNPGTRTLGDGTLTPRTLALDPWGLGLATLRPRILRTGP